MNIGVIGLGFMGRNHLRVLRSMPVVTEIAIAEIDKKSLLQAAKDFSISKIYKDYKMMLKKEKLAGVIVATPTPTHSEIALYIMSKHINVFVEKPLAHNISEAERMIKFAKKMRIILAVGHIERFNPVVTKIKEFLDKKFLKNIYLINTFRTGPFPKRFFGNADGVLTELAVHDFDNIHYLIGEIVSIRSQIIRSGKQEIYGRTLMDLKNGVKASSEFSWISPRRLRIVEIYGDSGMLLGDYYNQEVWFYENSAFKINPHSVGSFFGLGMIAAGKIIKYPVAKEEPLLLEMNNFLNTIAKKEKLFVKPEEALLVMKKILEIV